MASTTFTNFTQPAIQTAWLQDVNTLAYIVCGSNLTAPQTLAQLLANLGLTNGVLAPTFAATTVLSLAVTDNATVGGALGVTGATSLAGLSASGNATVGGTLGVTGAATLGSTLAVSGAASVLSLDITGATTSLAGTTAGTVVYAQPETGTVKKFAAYANGYENDTTVAQTITFPVAFANPPVVSANNTGLTVTATTTTLTIAAPDTTTAYSGVILVEGI